MEGAAAPPTFHPGAEARSSLLSRRSAPSASVASRRGRPGPSKSRSRAGRAPAIPSPRSRSARAFASRELFTAATWTTQPSAAALGMALVFDAAPTLGRLRRARLASLPRPAGWARLFRERLPGDRTDGRRALGADGVRAEHRLSVDVLGAGRERRRCRPSSAHSASPRGRDGLGVPRAARGAVQRPTRKAATSRATKPKPSNTRVSRSTWTS